ncbi:MAG TPA: hypothetical protein VFM68_02630 [Candidatus Saccharimonadales bacterium]|nr:hypothetical protein [Candidatus Saccharimonadales bacterium]
MDWAQILVIILSIFLAIFLLLAIILTILLIKVTRQIKAVTGTAMKTADGLEKIVAGFRKTSSPLLALHMLTKLFNKNKK